MKVDSKYISNNLHSLFSIIRSESHSIWYG